MRMLLRVSIPPVMPLPTLEPSALLSSECWPISNRRNLCLLFDCDFELLRKIFLALQQDGGTSVRPLT